MPIKELEKTIIFRDNRINESKQNYIEIRLSFFTVNVMIHRRMGCLEDCPQL